MFTGQYIGGEERCFLVKLLDETNPILGFDPEAGNQQTLSEVKWHSLDSMEDDLQVSRVITALNEQSKVC